MKLANRKIRVSNEVYCKIVRLFGLFSQSVSITAKWLFEKKSISVLLFLSTCKCSALVVDYFAS